MKEMNMEDGVALVTGGAGGIGRAACLEFARAGAKVVVVDIDAEGAERTAAEIHALGGQALATRADVSQTAEVQAYVKLTVDTFGRIDYFFNNAGIEGKVGPIAEYDEAVFDRVIAVNLRGSFLVGQAAIRLMPGTHAAPSRVILIASDMAYYGRETFSPYVASKHGVLGLTRSWAREFAPRILVNALCPGPIDTEMLGAANMSAEWREKELAIPLARFGQPEEIARLALFLASEGGAYITGQGIGINGGSIMP